MNLRHLMLATLTVTVVSMVGNPAYAQDESTPAPGTATEDGAESAATTMDNTAATTQPAGTEPTSDSAAAEDAMNDLLGSRRTAPVIEPMNDAGVRYPGSGSGAPAMSVDIDPAVLGIAPGEDPPPLRREGEFIVNRRGRLIRSAEGGHLLFVFESDAMDNPELPMVLQACQLLEAMEDTVQRRGEPTVFILSGQINSYRGANYLLPTMMKIAVDKGNLTN
jgi:hypothetical protein